MAATTSARACQWSPWPRWWRPPAPRTYAGRYDAEGIPVPTDVLVEDGDTITVGRVELTARHLTGHTPGSIALVYDDPQGAPHLFTGDCLFPGGIGNTHQDPRPSRAC
ncbi:MBL fold metallo-hydrolase [Streptomyces sp. CBG30]|nr:MBL fold metallo-hydrolase [Streptomyces sp. CBG30]